jgi:hypothetical protein
MFGGGFEKIREKPKESFEKKIKELTEGMMRKKQKVTKKQRVKKTEIEDEEEDLIPLPLIDNEDSIPGSTEIDDERTFIWGEDEKDEDE